MREDSVLNVDLDDDDILTRPPSMIIYGRPGAGKTTAVAQSFQNMFWIQTSPTVLRPYASWLRDNKDLAAKQGQTFPTGRKTINAYQEDGITPKDVRPVLEELIKRYAAAVQAGTCPYAGIVFDEYNEHMRRVFECIKRDRVLGANPFNAINELKRWNKWLCALPQVIKQPIVLISHEREPTYDSQDGSPTKGQLEYRGGPAFPIGTEIQAMTGAADLCLRIVIRAGSTGPKRIFLTAPDPLWECKFRDFAATAEEEFDLRKLLLKAGYVL